MICPLRVYWKWAVMIIFLILPAGLWQAEPEAPEFTGSFVFVCEIPSGLAGFQVWLAETHQVGGVGQRAEDEDEEGGLCPR